MVLRNSSPDIIHGTFPLEFKILQPTSLLWSVASGCQWQGAVRATPQTATSQKVARSITVRKLQQAALWHFRQRRRRTIIIIVTGFHHHVRSLAAVAKLRLHIETKSPTATTYARSRLVLGRARVDQRKSIVPFDRPSNITCHPQLVGTVPVCGGYGWWEWSWKWRGVLI